MKLSREIKTAILLIICLTVFFLGFSFLGGKSLFLSEKNIVAYYDEVEGLVVGSKVTISGMTIGKVDAISLADDYQSIKVSMSIRNDLTFSSSSEAVLYEAGLIGGKAIAIEPKYNSDDIFKNGAVLPSSKKPGLTELLNTQIVPLQDKIESMVASADSVLTGVSNILNVNSQKSLRKSIVSMSESVENINNISSQISQTMNRNSVTIDETFKNFQNTSQNFSKISDSLVKIEFGSTINEFKSVGKQLKSVLDKIESSEGTMGKFLNDEELYKNLAASTKSLEALLNDLKEHPKRYVHFSLFGRKEKKEVKK